MIIAGIILLSTAFVAFMVYASYRIEVGIYIPSFCRMSTNEKIVVLTFDDGPDSLQTPKILDVLKSHHVPATFFCIGSKIRGNEALIERIHAEGHHLGNHSYTHTWQFPLYSAQRMEKELALCQQQLEYISKQKITWFRPPFGVTNPTISGVIKKLGYTTIGWNIRSMDTQSLSHEKIIRRIRQRLRPGSIILLHDRMPESDILLKHVLDELKAEQYRVVGLETMIN